MGTLQPYREWHPRPEECRHGAAPNKESRTHWTSQCSLVPYLQERVVNARLFLGHLVNQDNQQQHHQYADHRPSSHPSAHPSVMVHR